MLKRPGRHKIARSWHREDAEHVSPPAQLVGVGFRLCLRGAQTGDLSYWDQVTRLYCRHLEKNAARAALSELSAWTKTVGDASARSIRINSDGCPGFCKDECLAIAMIAASQHKTCPAMRACAFALIEHGGIQAVVDQSEQFAMTLKAVDQVLSPNYIVNAAAISAPRASEYLQ